MNTIERIANVIAKKAGKPASECYEAANDVIKAIQQETIGSIPVDSTTMGELIDIYYKSPSFIALGDGTAMNYIGQIKKISHEFDKKKITDMSRRDIQLFINNMHETPSAANNAFKRLRHIMQYAVKLEYRADNPCTGVDMIKVKSNGFHTWTEIEIAQYIETHPLGTMQHLAMILMLYTGARRSEAIKLGPHSIKEGLICFQHLKGSSYTEIPIHPDLEDALDFTEPDNPTFLTNRSGRPFKPSTLSQFMRKACDAAGLYHCTAHGLKKSIAVRLAEAGCSEKEIMAITGHKTSAEVLRYTRGANQKALAEKAMKKMMKKKRR